MKIAIDTSTGMAGLALVKDSQVLAELTWYCGQNHTIQLLPRLKDLVDRSGNTLRDASAVIVAIGPGSFNGLRVGLSTAKGLALSLGVPIVGVSTLEIEAYPHAGTGLPVCAVANAGRGEIAAAIYRQVRRQWRRLVPEHITTLESLMTGITGRTVFCGEYIQEIAGQIKETLKQRAVIPPPASRLRRAVFLADLGQQRLNAGLRDDISTLQPIYLRRPPITQPRKPLTIGGDIHGRLTTNQD